MGEKKAIVLTSGEPAGIAPEITGLAWEQLRDHPDCAFFLLGDADYWQARLHGAVTVKRIATTAEVPKTYREALPVLHRPLASHPPAGRIDAKNARAVVDAIDEAVKFALDGNVPAIVTNPIQKETLYGSGFRHQGHTDYIADLARQRGFTVNEVMMLVAKELRTVPVTVHIPLAEVPRILTTDLILSQARTTAQELSRYFAIAKPRLAVTGLNPHAGENGSIGLEDRDIIAPAVKQLEAEGYKVTGPISADTAFHAEARAHYDAILCMYHDQALIPVKTLDFHGGINVSLGLPFIRTSPDHGTALDLAGTGKARPDSLVAAIRLAASMAQAAHG